MAAKSKTFGKLNSQRTSWVEPSEIWLSDIKEVFLEEAGLWAG